MVVKSRQGLFWIKKVITRKGHIIKFPKFSCHGHLIVPLQGKFATRRQTIFLIQAHSHKTNKQKQTNKQQVRTSRVAEQNSAISVKKFFLSFLLYFLFTTAGFYSRHVAIEMKINKDLERDMSLGHVLPVLPMSCRLCSLNKFMFPPGPYIWYIFQGIELKFLFYFHK